MKRRETDELQGVPLADWRGTPLAAQALGKALASRGLVAYAVIDSSASANKKRSDGRDKRGAARSRTRLRSAKLLDLGDRFLCECQIHDRSPNGFRLVLARNLPLPSRLRVCDDETQEVSAVALAWRRGAQIGVRILAKDRTAWLRPGVRAALRGRYYAIPD